MRIRACSVAFAAFVLLTTPGCVSFLTGLGCAASGGCDAQTMSAAMSADVEIGAVVVASAVESARLEAEEEELVSSAAIASSGSEIPAMPYIETPEASPTTPAGPAW